MFFNLLAFLYIVSTCVAFFFYSSLLVHIENITYSQLCLFTVNAADNKQRDPNMSTIKIDIKP